ncbi:MAG: winged helix-turn-helix domain-containing protein [Phycisphaeraceae bacterium]|nr:winged helix-turn-helix domain-containing protein [Phycisphaeraceae bacterium]QYK48987.1 MAG: winged helix-turn-helix domain-containing protein [Phycisphaeraceae bacterium]
MSKKTPTTKSKPASKTSSKPAPDTAANDKARADALAKLNAAPAKDATKRTKPSRGSKPEGWENDPLENDAALEAALAGTNAAPTPPTVAHGAKPAKGGGKNATAAKGTPTGEPRATGGKVAKEAKDAKTPAAKPAKPAKAKRISALDAAAKVLAESDRPLRAIDMIEVMHAKGLWTSPGGKTPEATLYAAITREIAAKGTDARFKKVDRGMFASTPAAPTTAKSGKGG